MNPLLLYKWDLPKYLSFFFFFNILNCFEKIHYLAWVHMYSCVSLKLRVQCQLIWAKVFLVPIEVNGSFVIHFGEARISLQLENYFLSLCGNVSFCDDRDLINDSRKLYRLMKSYHFEVRSFVLKCISAPKEFCLLYSEVRLFEIY